MVHNALTVKDMGIKTRFYVSEWFTLLVSASIDSLMFRHGI